MERRYLKNLEDWLNAPYRKPLLVYGARQVGKTYLIKDIFAEKHFSNRYIYVDCLKNRRVRDYLKETLDPQKIIAFLSTEFNMDINKDTLLIFDEAQECLPIITAMKYFCQERREIPMIVTGSMVRIKLKRATEKNENENGFLFPVGKINQLNIHPLDFGEYLYNRNKKLYDRLKDNYLKFLPLEKEFHELALDYFYDYLYVGGMPEAANVFLKSKDYRMTEKVLSELYSDYLSDMELYQISNEAIIRTRKIFDNIYSQLAKENKNFKVSNIEKDARNRDLASPIDWLEFACLAKKSYVQKERVTLPFDKSGSTYRIYLADMGIFTYQSKEKATTFFDSNSRNTLSGVYFENYVADELMFHDYELFYWKGKDECEFEFLIEKDGEIYPIDVKKKKGTLNSLEKYSSHNHVEKVIKVSQGYLGYDSEKKILTIPFYDFFLFLEEQK